MPTLPDRDENFYRLSNALARKKQPALGQAQAPGQAPWEAPPPATPALGGAPQQQAPVPAAAPGPSPAPAAQPEAGSFLQYVSPAQQQSVQPQAAPSYDLSAGFQNLGLADGGFGQPSLAGREMPLAGAWDQDQFVPPPEGGAGMQTRGEKSSGSREDYGLTEDDGPPTSDPGWEWSPTMGWINWEITGEAARAALEAAAAAKAAAIEEEAGRFSVETEERARETGERADEFAGDIQSRFGESSFDPIEEGIMRQRDESARMMAEMMAGRGMSQSGVQAGLAGDIYQKGWQDVAQARSQWERQQTDQMMQLASQLFGDKWRALDREQQLLVLQKMHEYGITTAQELDRMASEKPGQLEAFGDDLGSTIDPFDIGYGSIL